MKKGWHKRKYDRTQGRKSKRFIDRTGMVAHRLVYLEWLGQWGKARTHFWKALCDCGNYCEVEWRPCNTRSCGCLQAENRRTHGWETQRTDGKWGLHNEKRLRLADGTITTAREMCEKVGLTHRKMLWRVRNWPEHRWLEPKNYVGAAAKQRDELIAAKAKEKIWYRRPQPWASATMKRINAEGRNRPCSVPKEQASPSPSTAGEQALRLPSVPASKETAGSSS